MSTTFSPAVQAIWDAYLTGPRHNDHQIEDMLAVAAILRAAADQMVPKCLTAYTGDYNAGANNERIVIRAELLAIADELEADR